jgi:hypothetical protein
MLVGLTLPRCSPHKNSIVILIIAFSLFIGLSPYTNWVGVNTSESVEHNQTAVPLLLNSGVVQATEAEVSVVLWFENGDIPLEVWTKKPMQDWIWTYTELHAGSGKEAVTLSGRRHMDKNEESNLYTWYTIMAKQLAKSGGRIYLDERVSQATDISVYLSKTNTLPAQWALSGDLQSIAAYQSDLPMSVMAGQDRINIQLLSRGKNTEGQTVLAIPVLLEEF